MLISEEVISEEVLTGRAIRESVDIWHLVQNLPVFFSDPAARAAHFEATCLKQVEVIKALQERIEALERQVSLCSATGSRPPSSDGLKKPHVGKRTQSLRGKSGRKSGDQPGHKGETLRQTSTPDHVINHYPEICNRCGADLMAGMAERSVARQVVDLPLPPPPEVTGHRAHPCRCSRCDAVTRAPFPEGVTGPVQYGPRIMGPGFRLLRAICKRTIASRRIDLPS